jgi:AcrR family transcriptional regulator
VPRPPKAREPLKAEALRLFVERGIDGTGIRDVARAAQVSEAALYRHWPSKEALVESLYAEHLGLITQVLDVAVARESTWQQALSAAVAALYAQYDREPLGFRFVLLAQADLRLDVVGERTPLDAVRALAARADPAREVYLAAAWTGMFLQTAQYVLRGRLPPPLVDHAATVAELAISLARK